MKKWNWLEKWINSIRMTRKNSQIISTNWCLASNFQGKKWLLYTVSEYLVFSTFMYEDMIYTSDWKFERHFERVFSFGSWHDGDLHWTSTRLHSKENNSSLFYFALDDNDFAPPPSERTIRAAYIKDSFEEQPTEATFTEAEFKQALKETLIAYSNAYPAKVEAATKLITQFDL